jgi:ribosomal protein S18 acetylase RimI-like enzyme
MWFDPCVQPATRPSDAAILSQLEGYYDEVPRASARAEDFGSFTLFVRTTAGVPFYGRPTLTHQIRPTRQTRAAIHALLARQHELGLPQTLEWVHETTPALTEIAGAAGLRLHRQPLMLFDFDFDFDSDSDFDSDAGPTPVPIGADVRRLTPEDPALASAIAAAHLAFSVPGTAVGPIGRTELDAKTAELRADGWLLALADRMRAGRAVVVAAIETDGTGIGIAVGSGQHNPIDRTTEIVGVGTLPSVRRRGLAHAVTSALVADARARGIDTIFLSAGDEQIARIYSRIGFRRIGTALAAEPG